MELQIRLKSERDNDNLELESDIATLFEKYDAPCTKEYRLGPNKYEIRQIPNKGAIHFEYSAFGNIVAACIDLVGFDEGSVYYNDLRQDFQGTLKKYIV